MIEALVNPAGKMPTIEPSKLMNVITSVFPSPAKP
jgi:hypothetical protein